MDIWVLAFYHELEHVRLLLYNEDDANMHDRSITGTVQICVLLVLRMQDYIP